MNKTELVKQVAERTGLSKKDTESTLTVLTDVLTEVMATGDKITLVGFGTFESVEKPERTARNPRTGETVTIAACKSPKFKASKALKDTVNR
jgi:DNA-binding protein HU-beta